MLLTEIFDKPTQWRVEEAGGRHAAYKFEIDNSVYIVEIARSVASLPEMQVFDINFNISINGGPTSFALTNTGNQYTVFSTVADILKDFTSKNDVSSFFFNAKERSRISLYSKMILLFKRIGFPATTIKKNHKNIHYFIVARNDKELEPAVDRLSMLRGLE